MLQNWRIASIFYDYESSPGVLAENKTLPFQTFIFRRYGMASPQRLIEGFISADQRYGSKMTLFSMRSMRLSNFLPICGRGGLEPRGWRPGTLLEVAENGAGFCTLRRNIAGYWTFGEDGGKCRY
jgi:hypothetical protein